MLPLGQAADRARLALLTPTCPGGRQKKKERERDGEARGSKSCDAGRGAGVGWGGRCGECEVCSAPRRFASSASLPSPPLGEAIVHAASRTQAPLSGGDRTPLPPPSTLQDQSDPCLALRESRSSLPPGAVRWLFLSTTCSEMLSGGILGRRLQIWCLLAPLLEAVPS